jgi:hypothetical protein
MGVRLPQDPNVVVTVFTVARAPPPRSSAALALGGYEPVSVALDPRALSEWPRGEVVHVVPGERQDHVCYDVEIPPRLAWPSEWGIRVLALDFRIWYVRDGTSESVNRRTPTFSLPAGVPFVLEDHYHRELMYALVDHGNRKTVRPAYPAYGMLRVTYPPILDLSKPYGVTLRPKGEIDPDRPEIVGAAPVPGTTFFGPLAVGEYEARLQWFVAGSTSAFVPIRDLGIVAVHEGANDHHCE